MQNPMAWAIPLFRVFGIQVKLHFTYILITLVMLARVYFFQPGGKEHIGEFALIWVVILFVVILLHEFGHCFAARKVDGEAEEVLMWPLGGLAYCAVPHTPRANLITVLGGPAVNVAICVVTAGMLAGAGYAAPLNIFQSRQLYYPELYNWQTGTSAVPYETAPYFVEVQTGNRLNTLEYGTLPSGQLMAKNDRNEWVAVNYAYSDIYPAWVLWSARVFWMSWMLLLFNVCLPGFPMDGGRILQCILWSRSGDYRSATQVACWAGFMTALGLSMVALVQGEGMLFALAIFIVISSYHQLLLLNEGFEEGGAFGYDFSKGYGGFGPDEDAPPKPKRVGAIKRWLQARRARKIQREVEQRAADDTRLDQILEKITRLGKESLTPDERRFMDRVSARYRNRS